MKTDEDSGRESRLYLIAGAVADHEVVDWSTAQGSAPAEFQSLIRNLKIISGVSQTHRRNLHTSPLSKEEADREPLALPQTTWGPLKILAKVGEGVFGEVFRAHDPQLDREVALKLFYPDRQGRSRPTEQLIEEGRLLARVRHPHVAVVYGAEQHDQRVGIWMEYIEGSTLDEYISEKGTLNPAEAMAIGRDICSAVAALHDAEVVHRDIKASNVMREQSGRIVVLDLGASRDTSRHDSGQIYGTPFYAAPEVLIANETSCASDIYSIGVLLYYMVTGQYPVAGLTVEEIRQAHDAGQVKQLKELRSDSPDSFVNIVEKALAPEPSKRFTSANQFEQVLTVALEAAATSSKTARFRQWSVTLVAALIFAVSIAANLDRIGNWLGMDRALPPSLAVLFFDNLGPPGEDDFIAAGLTEDVITSLSQFGELDVLSRNAVTRYRDQDVDPQEVGQTFGVDYVLEGSVRRIRDSLRITAQLIDAGDGFHVWADVFEGDVADVFAIRDSIATQIATALNIEVPAEQHALVARRWTENAEAYAHFLVGREMLWHGLTWQEWADSRLWFEKALELDPEYAPALAGLAGVLSGFHINHEPGDLQRALDLAHTAQRLDPSLAVAWQAEGNALRQRGEVSRAQAAYEHAIELNPNVPEIFSSFCLLLWREKGDEEKAADLARRAIATDPYWPVGYNQLAWLYCLKGQYAEGDRVIREGMARSPEDPWFQYYIPSYLYYQKRYSEAIHEYRNVIVHHPDLQLAYCELGDLFRDIKRSAAADSVYQVFVERWPEDPEVLWRAGVHAYQCQRYEEAEDLLERTLNLNENHFKARGWLSNCLYHMGREDEAETIILDLVARWSDEWQAYAWICDFYYNFANDWDEAEKWATEMVHRFPEVGGAYSWLAWVYLTQTKFELAESTFRQAIAVRGTNYLDYKGLSGCLGEMDRQDEALVVARKWVDQRPRHTRGWHLLGTVYRSLGRYHQAAAAFERVLELGARGVDALPAIRDLAVTFGDEGRYGKQIETLQRAVAIDSTDVDTWQRMAEAAWIGLQDSGLAKQAARSTIMLSEDRAVGGWSKAYGHIILGDIAKDEGDLATVSAHYEQARDEIEAYLALIEDDPTGMSIAGRTYVRTGEMNKALECAAWLSENQRQDPEKCYITACIFSAAGDLEHSLEALEVAVAAGYRNRGYLLNDSDLENLRRDDRFTEILNSIE